MMPSPAFSSRAYMFRLKPSRSRRFVLNSLKIALVVGTLLNLVNQGSALFGDAPVSWWHLLMNYGIPFCVAYYSAWRNATADQGRHHTP